MDIPVRLSEQMANNEICMDSKDFKHHVLPFGQLKCICELKMVFFWITKMRKKMTALQLERERIVLFFSLFLFFFFL